MGTGGATGAAGNGGGYFNLIFPALIFAIFYFLLIRPQQKRAKEHQNMINALKKGDRVITSGGIHGRIMAVDDTTVSIEVAEKIRIKVSRGNIGTVMPGSAPAEKQ
ncbi:MAG: preprotein translocase subunit YajC [Deltaproteobacteria bacterium]|nr:MAG: preprotein translocase subunit YajC [Deltaproteobacteria bacterium]